MTTTYTVNACGRHKLNGGEVKLPAAMTVTVNLNGVAMKRICPAARISCNKCSKVGHCA